MNCRNGGSNMIKIHSMFEAIIKIYQLFCNYREYYGYSGQGEKYRFLVRFFQKYREKNVIWYCVSIMIKCYIFCLYNRRTVKSMKAPVRLQGWKGKR